MYTLGCSSSTIFHFQLDDTTGEIVSTANYTADASVTGSQSGGIFVATAFELAVLVGRPASDEVSCPDSGRLACVTCGRGSVVGDIKGPLKAGVVRDRPTQACSVHVCTPRTYSGAITKACSILNTAPRVLLRGVGKDQDRFIGGRAPL